MLSALVVSPGSGATYGLGRLSGDRGRRLEGDGGVGEGRSGGSVLRFWGTALLAALLAGGILAGAVPVAHRLEPRSGLRLPDPGELWLLATFTAGVLAVLLGLSVALGGWLRASRLRELLEEGPGPERDAADVGGTEPPAEGPQEEGASRPGWWVVAVGTWLLALYFVGWWILDPPA